MTVYGNGLGRKIAPLQERDNGPERNFEALARRNFWRPTKEGWPDFLCFDECSDEIIAVEVKPRSRFGHLQHLKLPQAQCMDFLKAHGIRCFVSDGHTLEPYSRDKHYDDAHYIERKRRRLERDGFGANIAP